MRRWRFGDICAAGLFFALAALFGWGFTIGFSDPHCTLAGLQPCSLSDMELRTYDLPLTAGLAVVFFGLGLRVLWGMRHGED